MQQIVTRYTNQALPYHYYQNTLTHKHPTVGPQFLKPSNLPFIPIKTPQIPKRFQNDLAISAAVPDTVIKIRRRREAFVTSQPKFRHSNSTENINKEAKHYQLLTITPSNRNKCANTLQKLMSKRLLCKKQPNRQFLKSLSTNQKLCNPPIAKYNELIKGRVVSFSQVDILKAPELCKCKCKLASMKQDAGVQKDYSSHKWVLSAWDAESVSASEGNSCED